MKHIEDKIRFYRESSFRLRDLRNVNPIRPVLDNSCFFRSKTDFVYDRHTHTAYELIVSESRPYSCFLNGGLLSMPAGRLLLVQPGDTHQGILEHGQELFVVTFLIESDGPEEIPALFRRDMPESERILDLEAVPDAMAIYRVFHELSRNDSPRSGYILGGLFTALFWTLLPAWPETLLHPLFLRETVQEAFRDNLIELFRKHVHGGPGVEELAAAMHMAPRSFERKCREVFGVPPKTAFLAFKFRHLERWVTCSDLSMKEIGTRYGFENQFHFSRLFKRQFGISPMQYRRERRKH